MSEHSPIGWTDATWPIVAGCEYVSPGCSNCWAVRDSWRMAHNPNPKVHAAYFGTVDKQESGKLVWSGIVRPLWQRLEWPFKWRGFKRVFVCSQSDLFNPKVPFEFIAAAFGVMAMAHWHTFQVLTKHPARALEFFTWLAQEQGGALATCLWHARQAIGPSLANRFDPYTDEPPEWPLENVHFGVTVEDQKRADERVPLLLQVPAATRWLSVEPMLEAINLESRLGAMVCCGNAQQVGGGGFDEPPEYECCHEGVPGIGWVVCGGESAQTRANTRPFDIGWARDLLAQCRAAGVPFFMKQLGTAPLWDGMSGPGQHWPAGIEREDRGEGFFRMLPPPGRTSRFKWHEPQHWPEDLRVQEFPT